MIVLAVAVLLVVQTIYSGESPKPTQQKRRGPPPGWRVTSPELHPDRRVSFRIYAPKASKVLLEAFDMIGKHRELSRGEDGVWSVTVGPVQPDIYTYKFLVDDVSTVDPKNHIGQYRASLLEVPGREAQFQTLRDVPHGVIHQHLYRSESIPGIRCLYVYTPPQYEQDTDGFFPVLYLLHGSAETARAWSTIGRAGIILDNLLAEEKSKPMVIVMPYGHTAPPSTKGWPFTASEGQLFARDLIGEIMPLVEKKYRISQKPESRALAGFSMGGAQTLRIGLRNRDRFSHLGVFSWGAGRDWFQKNVPAVLSQPEALNRQIRVFWIGCGRADFLYRRAEALHQCLTDLGVRHIFADSEGGHSWVNWRRYLHTFAQLLFRDPHSD